MATKRSRRREPILVVRTYDKEHITFASLLKQSSSDQSNVRNNEEKYDHLNSSKKWNFTTDVERKHILHRKRHRRYLLTHFLIWDPNVSWNHSCWVNNVSMSPQKFPIKKKIHVLAGRFSLKIRVVTETVWVEWNQLGSKRKRFDRKLLWCLRKKACRAEMNWCLYQINRVWDWITTYSCRYHGLVILKYTWYATQ